MRNVVVGTAGHIDHGKTLLVKALTGTDADRLPEEKARGITLDIGFAALKRPEGEVHFVDLPGHERFIRNMLAGATGIDLSLIVVAADESVMPQTVEHVEILNLLGVSRGVVALTKVDLVDEETLELAQLEVQELLDSNGLGNLPILPVSAVTGAGVPELEAALLAAARACPAPPSDRPFRLPIDRVFSVKGFGTVATGTCADGGLSVGDRVEAAPIGLQSKVRGLQVFGTAVERVVAGQRAAVNVSDAKREDLGRGAILCQPGTSWPTRLLYASVAVLPSARQPLKSGTVAALHIHTQEVEARVHFEGGGPLSPGATALAQIRTQETVCAWPGDRFILRLPSPARTVAGGSVLMLAKRKARWGRERDRGIAGLLRSGAAFAPLRALLQESGPTGASPEEVSARLGRRVGSVHEEAQALESEGLASLWGGGQWWLDGQEARVWLERASNWLRARQRGGERRRWLPRQELAGRWQRLLGPHRGNALLQAMAASGIVEIEGERVRLKGEAEALTGREKAAADALAGALKASSPAPRTGRELEEACGAAVRSVLAYLEEGGEIVRFGGDNFILPSALAAIRDALARKAAGGEEALSVPEFKEMFGLTRKHAMPLLEYLDEQGVTRREGEGRRILASFRLIKDDG